MWQESISYVASYMHFYFLNSASKSQETDNLFSSFLSKFVEVAKKADFSDVKKLYTGVASLSAGIPQGTEQKILQAEDFVSFIDIIKPTHCNWLNIYILQEISQKVDAISKEARELVGHFIQSIHPKKLTEAICHIMHNSLSDYTGIKETWSMNLDDVIIGNLINHQEQLASMLKIPKYSLVLQQIRPGIEIDWAIPTRLLDQAIESAKNNVGFKRYCILDLKIGSQQITVNDHHPVTEDVTG